MSSPSTPITLIGLGPIEYHSKEKCSANNSDGKRCKDIAEENGLCSFHLEIKLQETKKAAELAGKIETEKRQKELVIQQFKQESENSYERKKQEFEEKVFFIGAKFYYKQSNEEYVVYSEKEIKTIFSDWIFEMIDSKGKVKEVSFYELWSKDRNRKKYERIDFIPIGEECSPDVFNLFTGFEAEKYKCEFTEEQKQKSIDTIKKHLNYITSGYADEMLKWMASIIQNPSRKTEVAQYIRDEGSLFISGGGVGKNLIFDFFGEKILGKKYYHIVSDNKEIYADFNSIFEGKLLVLVEEASGKDNHKNTGSLKSKITKKQLTVNTKGIKQYKVKDYSNWIFTTNERNALPIRQEDRRFAIYDSNPEMRGNKEYFTNLVKILEDPATIYSFYMYLKEMETYSSPIEFQEGIQKTGAYKDIRRLNAPLIQKWLASEEGMFYVSAPHFCTDLYTHFCEWVKLYKEGSEESIPKLTAFGLSLKNSSVFTFKKTNKGNEYTTNMSLLISELKKLYLLDDDFGLKVWEETNTKIVNI